MLLPTMITIISGTNREGSKTLKLAHRVAAIYSELEAEVELIDLRELPGGLLNPGSYGTKPVEFEPTIERILKSDGLVLVIPEYNGSFPGVLKLFVDHLPFPESFDRRPACYIGLSAGRYGGLRPVEQMQQVFGYRNAFNYPVRVFIPGAGTVIAEGGAIADEEVETRLREQAAGFLTFTRQLRGRA